jgi:hypothetical protein
MKRIIEEEGLWTLQPPRSGQERQEMNGKHGYADAVGTRF